MISKTHGSTSIIIIIPPGKRVVGGDLALVMRVPHECEAGLFLWVVRNGSGRRDGSCCPPHGPFASDPRYGLPPYHGPPARMLASGRVTGPPLPTLPKGLGLQRLFMVGAPLVVVRCRGQRRRTAAGRVVAVRIRYARRGEARRVRVDIPVQALAGPLEDAVDRLAWRRRRREEQRTGEPVGRSRSAAGCRRAPARERDCRARGTGAASGRCR